MIAAAHKFQPFAYTDDYRIKDAAYWGGFQLLDSDLTWRLRGAFTEVIKKAGKSILSGNFNLVNLSFPIKGMMPLSLLELMPNSFSTCCTYLQKAASISDPVERMKLVMAVGISFMLPNQGFEKPLNPVLGETY